VFAVKVGGEAKIKVCQAAEALAGIEFWLVIVLDR